MKRFFISVLFIFLMFLSTQVIFAGSQQRPCNFTDPVTKESRVPKIFRPITNYFKKLFGYKRETVKLALNVECIELNRFEIYTSCEKENNSCLNTSQTIEIKTEARSGGYLLGERVVYHYQISGGKIIGEGSKVMWDLSGVDVGTYTIIVGADNGCGVCGKVVTKEVKVIECPKCS